MKREHILLLLAFLNFTHIIDSMLIMPLGDIFIKEFDLTASEFSWLVSAYATAAAISSFMGIFYLDKFDRRSAILLMFSGFSVGTFLCALAQSYWMLLALRFATGFFGGMMGALVLSVISDLYPFKERGKAMGMLMGAFSAASALGIPVGLYLAAKGTWHVPFFIIGAMGMILCGFMFWKFPIMRQHLTEDQLKQSHIQTVKNIVTDKNQLNALLLGFILILGHFIIIPFISPYLIKNVGLTQLEISYQFFFGGVATIFSAYFIGRLTDTYGVVRVFTVMMILCFIPIYLITNLEAVPLWVALTFTTMFFITASGRMIPANTIITAAAPDTSRGSFMSLKSSLQQLAISIAALASGMFVYIGEDDLYHGYEQVGYLSIIIGLSTIFILRMLKVAKGN